MSKKRAPQGYKVKPVSPPVPAADEPVEAAATAVDTVPPPAADVPEAEAIAEPGVTELPELPKWEHSLIDVEPEPVSERDLVGLVRDWRRGRATKTLRQVLADGYVAVFAVVMIVAMLGGAVFQAQRLAQGCTSDVCTTGRALLPWVAMGAAFCLTAMASRIFGPVVASAAEGFWLMDAPIRRGRLLVKRLIGVILAVTAIAAVLGGLLAALTGYELSDIWRWALAMGIGAGGLTALAAAEQTWGRTWLIATIQWLCGVVAVGVLFIIVSMAANWFGFTLTTIPGTNSVVWVAIAGAAVFIASAAVALARLGMIHRARLVSGGRWSPGCRARPSRWTSGSCATSWWSATRCGAATYGPGAATGPAVARWSGARYSGCGGTRSGYCWSWSAWSCRTPWPPSACTPSARSSRR